MTSAYELALFGKWSSEGTTIIVSSSSPTSPKTTKLCCCSNKRRYNLKHPKISKRLHVSNVLIDNDFAFIDASSCTSEEPEKLKPSGTSRKNYKRSDTWPSDLVSTVNIKLKKNNPCHAQHIANKRDISQRQKKFLETLNITTAIANDYSDITEIVDEFICKPMENKMMHVDVHKNGIFEHFTQIPNDYNIHASKLIFYKIASEKETTPYNDNNNDSGGRIIFPNKLTLNENIDGHSATAASTLLPVANVLEYVERMPYNGLTAPISKNPLTKLEPPLQRTEYQQNSTTITGKSTSISTQSLSNSEESITPTSQSNNGKSNLSNIAYNWDTDKCGDSTVNNNAQLSFNIERGMLLPTSSVVDTVSKTMDLDYSCTVHSSSLAVVKCGHANESTTMSTITMTTTTSTITTPMSTIPASLPLPTMTVAERTTMLTRRGYVQDAVKENKPSLNVSIDTALSVKERIAAFVAGNENVRQHDNIIIKRKPKDQYSEPIYAENYHTKKPIQERQISAIIEMESNYGDDCNKINQQKSLSAPLRYAVLRDCNDNSRYNLTSAKDTAIFTPNLNSTLETNFSNNINICDSVEANKCTKGINIINNEFIHSRRKTHATENVVTSNNSLTQHFKQQESEFQPVLSYSIATKMTKPTTTTTVLSTLSTSIPLEQMRGEIITTTNNKSHINISYQDDNQNGSELKMDNDDDDPYFILQKYLERVKHEINEVFELHKARQQQMEQMHLRNHVQQQLQEKLWTKETQTGAAIKTPVSKDTLPYSIESDSIGTCSDNRHYQLLTHTKVTIEQEIPNQMTETSKYNKNDKHMTKLVVEPCSTTNIFQTNTASTKNYFPIKGICKSNTMISKLLPPPIGPYDSTLLQLRQQLLSKSMVGTATGDVNLYANRFLVDLDNLMASGKRTSSSSVITSPKLLSAAATTVIQSRYGKVPNSNSFTFESIRTSLSPSASANNIVVRPQKHATIPLQSFNLKCGSPCNSNLVNASTATDNVLPCENNVKKGVGYLRTISIPAHQGMGDTVSNNNKESNHRCNDINKSSSTTSTPASTTILKIEEASAKERLHELSSVSSEISLLQLKQLGNLSNEMEHLRNTSIDQSQQLSLLIQQSHFCASNGTGSNSSHNTNSNHFDKNVLMTMPPPFLLSPSRTLQASHQVTLTTSSLSFPSTTITTATAATANYILHDSDVIKKKSNSIIWTSEESILRSFCALEEDNNSISSSAYEEVSGILSSSKSGLSLDSSGIDNDHNESGINIVTPPKDFSNSLYQDYYHHNNNQSDYESESKETMRKEKCQNTCAISDEPDFLEIFNLCDETNCENQCQDRRGVKEEKYNNVEKWKTNKSRQNQYNIFYEYNDIHDEFGNIPCCDNKYENCNANSNSAVSIGNEILNTSNNVPLSGTKASVVVLRHKYLASPLLVPRSNRSQKCRSYSMDTSSLPNYHPMQAHHVAKFYHHHYPHAQLVRKLQNLRDRHVAEDRKQLSLKLRQEPFQSLAAPHFHELPSPSSASLHNRHEILNTQELSTKSNSAPLLLKQEECRDDFSNANVTLRYSRSQSDRYLAEIEAVEACKWLRAAGFPQYAQMYEDREFPIDLSNVAKDHTSLEHDQLQSLYRRLFILNRCAKMRIDQSHRTRYSQKEDSDDENFALSENWTFEPHIRRWSRINEIGLDIRPGAKLTAEKMQSSSKGTSPERLEYDETHTTRASLLLTMPSINTEDSADMDLHTSLLKRTNSERLRDGAKAFLRRVESIKSSRRKRQGFIMSEPKISDFSQLTPLNVLKKPHIIYSTPPSPLGLSPEHSYSKSSFFGNDLKASSQNKNFLSANQFSPKNIPKSIRQNSSQIFTNTMPHLKENKSDDSSSYYSDSQESSSTINKCTLRKTFSRTRGFLQRTDKVDDIATLSDSECHQGRKLLIKDANLQTRNLKIKKISRGGSLNLGRNSKKKDGARSSSFRSRSINKKESRPEDLEDIKRAPVVRWHSFQMNELRNTIFHKCFSPKNEPQTNKYGIPFVAMSAGQLQMLRKLALVILTGYMERYCPSHRSGWNWELPKFIKKRKMPDYKDKKVFGVPLLLILQRTGQTIPIAVRAAFSWLQLNALDQVGLFRKSGVKSRIIKLRELIEFSETTAECMDVFDSQQAYDVADMLKQYFRDLPESLLTTKMSETFAAIFQHLPPEVRLDAVQCAILLLPDENREMLYALLEFLTLVAANAKSNQMTANNLAVCLAPSLFHTNNSVVTSPRHKGKGSGLPGAKDLFEAKASHECLTFIIENYKYIFTSSKEKVSKCKFGYMEESKPLPLDALGEGMQYHNWRGYLYESTNATIKEGREKSRGWIALNSTTYSCVEIAYKKVGDGHPLRLWRCITEIEGSPSDILEYIIHHQSLWDPKLLQSFIIKKLDECTEIYQYALDGQHITDYCVLRSWRSDLPRGACVIVETSIDHPRAKPMYNAIRGVVLASRYLIETCGSGRSRVMHLSRVDVKGKTPEWYNKSYGHISAHHLTRIRLAFKNLSQGFESKR